MTFHESGSDSSGTQPSNASAGDQSSDSPHGGAEELMEQLRRERANFLNYKRRVEQKSLEDQERARSEIITPILETVDEFERAIRERPADLDGHPWVEGVNLIYRRLIDSLRTKGIERIGEEGEVFDPSYHEALFYEERPDVDGHQVVAVIRPGYRMGERVIRPARVSVAGPAGSADDSDVSEGSPDDAPSDRH